MVGIIGTLAREKCYALQQLESSDSPKGQRADPFMSSILTKERGLFCPEMGKSDAICSETELLDGTVQHFNIATYHLLESSAFL